MAEYTKTPLTTEEINALREYEKKLQALEEEKPERLTLEQWDEALEAIHSTGVIPKKYADRIEKKDFVTYFTPEKGYSAEGITTTGYYDIRWEEWNAKLVELNKKYSSEIIHVLKNTLDIGSETEEDSLEELIQSVIHEYMNPKHNLPPLSALMNASEFNTLHRILLSDGALTKSTVTRSEKINVEQRTDDGITTRRYTRSNRGDEHIITITNADVLLKKNNRHIKKLLPFTLQKMQQQSFPSQVAIDMEELVSLGMYSNVNNAWRGLSAFAQTMENIDIHWKRKVKNKANPIEEGGILIYHRKRRQNIGYLSVNENFPIAALAKEYTVFPTWTYSLPIKAFDLVLYIFYIARQKKDDILRTGGFNLSLKAIHERLGLPTVKEVERNMNRKYKERIRQPIEEAIEAIEGTVSNSDAAGKFFITPMTNDDTNSIDEWLQGYVRIELKDEYAEKFKTIAEHKHKQIDKAEKARIKAIAEAQAKNK